MRKAGLFIFFVFTLCQVKAQLQTIRGAANSIVFEKKYGEVQGSPYLFDEWKSGTVSDKSGHQEQAMIRCDLYQDVIEVNRNGVAIALDPNRYGEIFIEYVEPVTGKILKKVFKGGFKGIPEYKGYFEVLAEGKVTFLKKHRAIMKEVAQQNYGGQTKAMEFAPQNEYFLVFQDGRGEAVKLSKKSFSTILSNGKDAISAFTEKNKLKSEDDFVEFVKYYNAL